MIEGVMDHHPKEHHSLRIRVYPNGDIEIQEQPLRKNMWAEELVASIGHHTHQHPQSQDEYWGALRVSTPKDDREEDLWEHETKEW